MCNKRSEMVFGNQNYFCKNQMLYQMGLKKELADTRERRIAFMKICDVVYR